MATGTTHTTTTYMQPQPVYAAPAPVVVTQTTSGGNSMREAIPAFPAPIAIFLCIINFFLPGIGTIIAGFGVLCCGNTGQSGGSRIGTCCINIWVGILQLLLAIFIVGWVWSIMWGYAFIASSVSDEPPKTTTTVVAPTMMAPPPPTVITPTHHAH